MNDFFSASGGVGPVWEGDVFIPEDFHGRPGRERRWIHEGID